MLNNSVRNYFECSKGKFGHMTELQAEFITEQLKENKLNNVLEIGFAGGRHTYTVLKTFSVKKWITVDIDYDYHNGRHKTDDIKKEFDNVEIDFVEGDSRLIITNDFMTKNFPEGIDYALVDGGHGYDVALKDMQNVFKHLKAGGIMIVDDYKSKRCPIKTVDMAVEHFAKNNKVDFQTVSLEDGKGMAVFRR